MKRRLTGAGSDGMKQIAFPLLTCTMIRTLLFVFALTLTSIPSISVAATFTGNVISVLDGDTIEVLHSERPERIRLTGIDCPEKACVDSPKIALTRDWRHATIPHQFAF
jgi:endonuclease YncB( thermonuclease family)